MRTSLGVIVVRAKVLVMKLETVYELTDEQIEDYWNLYQSYLWWQDRTLKDVRTAVENTDVVVGLADSETDELVAAGRVFTDFVYYGKIYDVIVKDSLRGHDIGHELMDKLVSHPGLESLDVLVLDCREGLVPFYEACGFKRHELTAQMEDRQEDLVPMKYERQEV
jgi:predicted GNAT family N-acyltransferase